MEMEKLNKEELIKEFDKWNNEKYCLQEVKKNGFALQFVKNQTDDICLQAVKENGCVLKFVENQTDDMCMEAVKQNGYLFKYVKNQTDDICMEAVKQDINNLKYVKNRDTYIKIIDKLNIEKQITINIGMVTHYNDLIEKYVNKYIKENYRVKSPIIQYLRQIINTIESGLGGKISLTKFYLICCLTIEVDILKVHFVTIEIKNPNDNKKREFQLSEGGFGTMSMLECNKSFIKFIHQFNREYDFNNETKYEENNKIMANQVDIFINKLKDQFKIVDDKLEKYKNGK